MIGKLVFVTPKYEEEFGIRPKAILPSTDAGKNRIQEFLSGKIFNGEFWMLSMMKFKDKARTLDYIEYFKTQESVLQSFSAKVVFRAFDYVCTVIDGGGLVRTGTAYLLSNLIRYSLLICGRTINPIDLLLIFALNTKSMP